MQFYQRSRGARLATPILCIVLGALLLIWPGISVFTVCYLLGGLLIAFGIWQVIQSALRGMAYWGGVLLSIGILSLLIGAGFVLFPRVLSSILPVMLGIGLVLDGIARLSFSIQLKALYGSRWFVSLLFALLVLIAGGLMLLQPFGSAMAFTMIAGAFLLVTGAANLIGWFAER